MNEETKEQIRAYFKEATEPLKNVAREYELFDIDPDVDDMMPGLQITIASDGDNWAVQTGDNSYSGSAYSFPHWGVVWLLPDSTPEELADDAIGQIEELMAQ